MKKTLFLVIAILATINIYKANANKQQSAITLENIETEACCLIEITQTCWQKWCNCGGNQDCPCFDGWSKGFPFYR